VTWMPVPHGQAASWGRKAGLRRRSSVSRRHISQIGRSVQMREPGTLGRPITRRCGVRLAGAIEQISSATVCHGLAIVQVARVEWNAPII